MMYSFKDIIKMKETVDKMYLQLLHEIDEYLFDNETVQSYHKMEDYDIYYPSVNPTIVIKNDYASVVFTVKTKLDLEQILYLHDYGLKYDFMYEHAKYRYEYYFKILD